MARSLVQAQKELCKRVGQSVPCTLHLEPTEDPETRQLERLVGNRDRTLGLGESRALEKMHTARYSTVAVLRPGIPDYWAPPGWAGRLDSTGFSRGRWSEEGPDPQPTREWWIVCSLECSHCRTPNLQPLGSR